MWHTAKRNGSIYYTVSRIDTMQAFGAAFKRPLNVWVVALRYVLGLPI